MSSDTGCTVLYYPAGLFKTFAILVVAVVANETPSCLLYLPSCFVGGQTDGGRLSKTSRIGTIYLTVKALSFFGNSE